MLLRRVKMLLKCYFTGIVEDTPVEVTEVRARNWRNLNDKQEFLARLAQQSIARRNSMTETAARSNYLLVVNAFAIGGNATIFVATTTEIIAQIFLAFSFCMILLSACVLAIAIAAKTKVLKKPRRGGEYEPDEMLLNAVKVQEQAEKDPTAKQDDELNRISRELHKRKIVLLVERRAQWVATMLMVSGLLAMTLGICIQLMWTIGSKLL